MKILIIGDYPKNLGGVCNYTRPMSIELSKNNEVIYLYSNSFEDRFSIGSPKIRLNKELNYPFKSYEVKNGKAFDKNYDNLKLDTNNWFDRIFKDFLEQLKPDIVHIHEFIGFSSNLINICKLLNIPVVVTVHEYWLLCPHRVMVDFNNRICPGPDNLSKCTFCVNQKLKSFSSKRKKVKILLKNNIPFVNNLSIYLWKKIILQKSNRYQENKLISLDFKNIDFTTKPVNQKLRNQLENRLNVNISNLNKTDRIIAVSNDVKSILTKYGVNENLIHVQHIGSVVASNTLTHTKKVEQNKIVFGFIGGVSYYKGIHQLVEAFLNLPKEKNERSELKIFGRYSDTYFNSIKAKFNIEDKNNIHFYGKFSPEDLNDITNKIDIAILPSLCADTAPQTIFESFSFGLPIIAPQVGGFPDFIEENVNGLLYKPGNAEDLSKKMEYILDNQNLLTSFQNNIPKMKTINENVLELNQMYYKLVN